MVKVGIITDTISCLPPEIIKKYDIRIIPVPLNINGKPYRDGVDIQPDGFWDIFPSVKEFTTGAPPLSEFTDIMAEVSKKTKSIACVFVSKALSAINETAIQANNLFKKDNPDINIEIIDSRTAAGAEGFIVEEMARAALADKNLAQVVKAGIEVIPKAKFVTTMQTLKYLIRSGRAPKTAYMGELFQVKPIIGMVNNTGLVENLGRARGKKKALTKLLEIMEEQVGTDQPIRVNVHYTNSIDDGEQLKQMVTTKFNCTETYFTPYTPVMSGHTGPVVAVSFMSSS